MLPPQERLTGAQIHRYIKDSLYWVLHAPRQTGKTTFLQSWARDINAGGEAVACYVSVERCQGVTEAGSAIPAVCEAIQSWAERTELPVPADTKESSKSRLNVMLTNWAQITAPKPLIVLFDEVDVLEGDAIISFLRQLRDGFVGRGAGKFPTSIALVGMRDLKDYITLAKDGVKVNPGSPFNIKEDSSALTNFSRTDIEKLFAQRTEETNQQITEEALNYVWGQSYGQPWIVNSLFKRATMRVLEHDCYDTVTIDHVTQAREQMVLARETHFDALAARLEIPEVRKVMETLVTGEPDPALLESEDYRICSDLGLVTLVDGTPSISNPMYREIIARQMTFSTQAAIQKPEWQWKKPDGSLDMETLLKEFQKFWRKHSEVWEVQSNYHEAFPHLLLMAFLQRVLNGGGSDTDVTVDNAFRVCDSKLQYKNRHGCRFLYEYAAGRGRMDLAVEYNNETYIIEVKLIHYYNSYEEVREEGIEQIGRYRDTVKEGAPAYLVIFDRRPKETKKSWEERLHWEVEGDIIVIGC